MKEIPWIHKVHIVNWLYDKAIIYQIILHYYLISTLSSSGVLQSKLIEIRDLAKAIISHRPSDMKVSILFLVLAFTAVQCKHFLIQTKDEQGSESLPELEPESASLSSSPPHELAEEAAGNNGDDILDVLEEEEKEQTGDDYIIGAKQGI